MIETITKYMPHQVHLLTHPELHSTGHYFAAAARRAGASVLLDTDGTAHPLAAEDMLLYVDPGPRSFPLGIEGLKAIRAAYLIDVHQHLQSRLELAPLFDLIFVAQRDYVGRFLAEGCLNARWLPLACDPHTHCVKGLTRTFDVGFVGQLGRTGTFRRAVLSHALPKFRTNDFGRFYGPVEMGRVYSQSKIVLNASVNRDLNMRVFEALAAGALLVTDRIDNGLDELFVEGQHYVGYSSPEEAVSQIDRYLRDNEAREAIAQAGQALVLSQHTYDQRWRAITEAASTSGIPQSAPVTGMSGRQVSLAYGRILESRRDAMGLLRLMKRRGISIQLGLHFLRAAARAVNAVVPLTPNAIRSRVRAR